MPTVATLKQMFRRLREVGPIRLLVLPLIYARYFYYQLRTPPKFTYDGEEYEYFYHPYNSLDTERIVEVPIAIRLLLTSRGNVLEVGNVLSHYMSVNHTIVDKYEKAQGVLNVDILDFSPNTKYDLILCISTLEHTDDPPAVLKKLQSLLSDRGMAMLTIPRGYNQALDEYLDTGDIKHCKKRMLIQSRWNRWTETDNLKGVRYNTPYLFANGLTILYLFGTSDSGQ